MWPRMTLVYNFFALLDQYLTHRHQLIPLEHLISICNFARLVTQARCFEQLDGLRRDSIAG